MLLDVIETSDTLTHLALNGRLDTEGAGRIESQFSALTVAHQKNTIVDISGVAFIASMGIRVLISTAKALKRHNHKLVLVGTQPLVGDILRTAGIDQIVTLAEDLQQAQALLGG